jgi:gliding motility-associated-like protein
MKKKYTFLLIAVFIIVCQRLSAQMPQCNDSIIYYIDGFNQDGFNNQGKIYNYNPYLPTSTNNPALNTINASILPDGDFGGSLAVWKNINGTGSSPTFYVVGYSLHHLYYYDGTKWVNTGHSITGTNIGGGNNYIFGFKDNSGEVYRYDGSSDAIYLTTIQGWGTVGGPNDIVVDYQDNWYSLKTEMPNQFFRKYNSTGSLLQTWTITGAPNTFIGGGFAVVNNTLVYTSYPDFSNPNKQYKVIGIIGDNTVVINSIDSIFKFSSSSPLDWANCPVRPSCSSPVLSSVDTIICPESEYELPSGKVVSIPSIYRDTLKNILGCDSILTTVNLNVYPLSIINVIDSFYNGQAYKLPSGIVVKAAGDYQSLLKDIHGCDSIINTKLIVLQNTDCNVRPPKVFTPNGDGHNDTWVVFKGDCIKQITVSVYNRWGGLVYHSENYSNDWDGKYEDKALPDATYYYVILATYYDGHTRELTGNVTIIR